MDVFRLFNTGTTWANGTPISGLKTKIWVERFNTPGEFTFTGEPTIDLIKALPLGALVSHTGTLDVMMVENHEIKEKVGESPVIIISGRSLFAFLENRVATDHGLGFKPSLKSGSPKPYIFNHRSEKAQVVALIRRQIQTGYVAVANFALPHTRVTEQVTTNTRVDEDEVARGELYSVVAELLADMPAGLRIERPHNNKDYINWIVHNGKNRKATVQFAHDSGHLESARYFESNKTDRNAAYITASYWGKYWSKSGSFTGFARRVMWLSVSNLRLNPKDKDVNRNRVISRIEKMLNRRASRVVRKAKKTAILEATISKDSRYIYRRDYMIGDLVYVVGNYETSDTLRIIEYTETEDEDGETGYPTLARDPED